MIRDRGMCTKESETGRREIVALLAIQKREKMLECSCELESDDEILASRTR